MTRILAESATSSGVSAGQPGLQPEKGTLRRDVSGDQYHHQTQRVPLVRGWECRYHAEQVDDRDLGDL